MGKSENFIFIENWRNWKDIYLLHGSYAQTHFPCKLWDAGEKGLTLSAFEWEKDRKTLIYGQVDYMYGEAAIVQFPPLTIRRFTFHLDH